MTHRAPPPWLIVERLRPLGEAATRGLDGNLGDADAAAARTTPPSGRQMNDAPFHHEADTLERLGLP